MASAPSGQSGVFWQTGYVRELQIRRMVELAQRLPTERPVPEHRLAAPAARSISIRCHMADACERTKTKSIGCPRMTAWVTRLPGRLLHGKGYGWACSGRIGCALGTRMTDCVHGPHVHKSRWPQRADANLMTTPKIRNELNCEKHH